MRGAKSAIGDCVTHGADVTYLGAMRLPLALGVILCAMLSAVPAAAPAAGSAPAERAAARQIAYTQWDGAAEWRTGTFAGTKVANSRLVLAAPTDVRRYAGRTYDQGSWDSPWVAPGFALTQLIPSWSAVTPSDTWLEVRVRASTAGGQVSSWDVLGRWTSGDRHTKRQTVSGQTDDIGKVDVDTWQSTSPAGVTAYQVRVQLLRRSGLAGSPSVDTVGAVASRLPSGRVSASQPGPGRGIVLDVPRYSQMVHRGHYPAWGNGGQAWCSPTSTSMVLGYYDALPAPTAYKWVPAGHTDPWVDYAARMTYDSDYEGTGNWAFNTAYAAPRVGKAFVTRLRSLREAESYIAAGIPIVASISYGRGELTGSAVSSSNGHLLVVVGFTRNGDVVGNDPASTTRAGVRRTYDRGEFENAWLPTSGGTVYVIHDAAHPLP
jgi:hypothetical protein